MSCNNDYNAVREVAIADGLAIAKTGIKKRKRNLFVVTCGVTGSVLSNPQFVSYFKAVIIQDGSLKRFIHY